MEITVAGLDELAIGGTISFDIPGPRKGRTGFIINTSEGYKAYYNKCMHWPVPLDMDDGEFYHQRTGKIICKTHGAVYTPETGFCEGGPCQGAFLKKFGVDVSGGRAVVTVPDDL